MLFCIVKYSLIVVGATAVACAFKLYDKVSISD